MAQRLFEFRLAGAERFGLREIDVQQTVAIGVEEGGSGGLLLHEIV